MKRTLLFVFLGILSTVSCATPAATPPPPSLPATQVTATELPVAPTFTAPPTAATSPSPTATAIPPTSTSTLAAPINISPTPSRPSAGMDATTLNGKVIFGYQGWFSCPNDGSNLGVWGHWTKRSKTFQLSELAVDYWPDVSELQPDERCATDMKLPDGSPALVFSSFNPRTVDRHFKWMEEYGIDGVALQRFVTDLKDPKRFDFRNQVLRNVRVSAEAHHRVFYVEYDATGADSPTLVAMLKKDWAYLVDQLKITESPAYLHDHGLPVLAIYGFGFGSHAYLTADQAQQTVEYLKTSAPPADRATLIGGVPSYWRTSTRDSSNDPAWAAVYRSFDVISPWAVTRYRNDAEADQYKNQVVSPDLAETAKNNARYMPVIFPGFSWTNLNQGPFNAIPRQCGKFYWHQAFNVVSAGAKMIFVAMFDEVDEGTAMFKLAATPAQMPADAKLVPLNIDSCTLPSDWYLQLGGQTGRLLRGEIPLSPDISIRPN